MDSFDIDQLCCGLNIVSLTRHDKLSINGLRCYNVFDTFVCNFYAVEFQPRVKIQFINITIGLFKTIYYSTESFVVKHNNM